MSTRPLLEGPEKFSHPESRSKISNLRITEMFASILGFQFKLYHVVAPLSFLRSISLA